jgi:hypothetical protein
MIALSVVTNARTAGVIGRPAERAARTPGGPRAAARNCRQVTVDGSAGKGANGAVNADGSEVSADDEVTSE